jgi:hypothetical protein
MSKNLTTGTGVRPQTVHFRGEEMKRTAQALALAAALSGGCVTTDLNEANNYPEMGAAYKAKEAPNMVGPWGQPVAAKPKAKQQASGIQQVKHEKCTADGCPDSGYVGREKKQCFQGNTTMPRPRATPMAGAVAATGAIVGPNMAGGFDRMSSGRTSVRFVGPSGMKVAWYNGQGPNGFGPTMVETPGRYNFPQAAVYRLKLSDLPNRPGVELYPTLEVIPSTLKSATFLAHSAVPLGITEEDLEQVAAGNFIVKVIYLPDPAYQDLASAGPDEIVSSRLEPGVDPVAEATRRGSVLLILRLGNIDLEAPNSPRMDAPPGSAPQSMGQQLPPGAIITNEKSTPPGTIVTNDQPIIVPGNSVSTK